MQQSSIIPMLQAAVEHHGAGRLKEASRIYGEILARHPNQPDALNLLGVAMSQAGQGEMAIQLMSQAITQRPDDPNFHNNLSNAFHELGRFDEAIAAARQAVRLNPKFAAAHSNLGNGLKATGQLAPAISSYRQALRLDSSAPEVHRNLGLALLLTGQFTEGWYEFEWRWKLPEYALALYRGPQPRWAGADLRGRTIMLHAEQGFGDVIQFIRYVPVLQEQGAKVIFLSPPELVPLLRSVRGLDLKTVHEPMAPFDFWLPLLSVPNVLGGRMKTIPPQNPPLCASAELIETWRQRLGPADGRLRVGLAWAGSPAHRSDKNRSMQLSQLAPLAAVTGCTFYSLQMGPAASGAAKAPDGMNLIDLTAHIHDFADSAALLSQLDLLISVDTAPLHLAGALGKPAWVMLPSNVDWRWRLNREDSEWYPSLRLFRQKKADDWTDVIAAVAKALEELRAAK